MKLDECVPAFRQEIALLAAANGKTPGEIYSLWCDYVERCDSADQSPVLFEFRQWYQLKG
jgi:hypothetical protein